MEIKSEINKQKAQDDPLLLFLLGRAKVSTPDTAHTPPTKRPRLETGTMSPYPTVVMVMMAHQNVAGGRGERGG